MADPVTDKEAHREWREWLVQTHHQASQDFDKAVVTLSGAALGISLAFIRDIAPHPTLEWALSVAWVCLTVSLLLIFVTLLTSQKSLLNSIARVDERSPDVTGGVAGRATIWLNGLSAVALVLGVAFLVLFAAYNL